MSELYVYILSYFSYSYQTGGILNVLRKKERESIIMMLPFSLMAKCFQIQNDLLFIYFTNRITYSLRTIYTSNLLNDKNYPDSNDTAKLIL